MKISLEEISDHLIESIRERVSSTIYAAVLGNTLATDGVSHPRDPDIIIDMTANVGPGVIEFTAVCKMPDRPMSADRN